MNYQGSMEFLIDEMIVTGALRSESIIEAFKAVDRIIDIFALEVKPRNQKTLGLPVNK